MTTGMMWVDADGKRPFAEKVKRAAEYYNRKYGHTPTICFVSPKQQKEEVHIGAIHVKPVTNIVQHHFWLGVGLPS